MPPVQSEVVEDYEDVELLLPIAQRGHFFKDSYFKNARKVFEVSVKEILEKNSIKVEKDIFDNFENYRELRAKECKDETQAVSVTDDASNNKIILDVREFMTGDLRAVVLGDFELMVEGFSEEQAGQERKYFCQRFYLPQDITIEESCAALSSDGVLAIISPKLGDPGAAEVDDEQARKLSSQQSMVEREDSHSLFDTEFAEGQLPILRRGNFFVDGFFKDTRTAYKKVLGDILAKFGASAEDEVAAYNKMRAQNAQDGNQASTITETDKARVIILDVKNFITDGEVGVKLAEEKILHVTGQVDERKGNMIRTKTFNRQYTFPSDVDMSSVVCVMSSDGILAMTARKRPQEPRKVSTKGFCVPICFDDWDDDNDGDVEFTITRTSGGGSQQTQKMSSSKKSSMMGGMPAELQAISRAFDVPIQFECEVDSEEEEDQRGSVKRSVNIPINCEFEEDSDEEFQSIQVQGAKFSVGMSTSSQLKNRNLVPISKRGKFFIDSVYITEQQYFKMAVENVLQTYGVPYNDDNYLEAYETLRLTSMDDIPQAGLCAEMNQEYKILMDMKDYVNGSVNVELIGDNNLVIEGSEEKDGPVNFQQHFTLPMHADMEAVQSSLSEDGVLSITVPLKEASLKPTTLTRKISSQFMPGSSKGKSIEVMKKGIFSQDEYFTPVQQEYKWAVNQSLKRAGITSMGDDRGTYDAQRQDNQNQAMQAIISAEDEDFFKILLDMQDYMNDDIQVKVLDDNTLQVEAHRANEDGSTTCVFQRCFALPGDINIDTILAALASDGILSITAPKKMDVKDLVKNRKFLNVMKKGQFATDNYFESSRPQLSNAVKKTLKKHAMVTEGDIMTSYRTLCQTNVEDEPQVAVCSEDKENYKVLLDMAEFANADVKVEVLCNNDLMVEAQQGDKVYKRHLVIPKHVNVENATTALSSDGILTISAPVKKEAKLVKKRADVQTSKHTAVKLTMGFEVPIAYKGVFSKDECFKADQQHYQAAVSDVIKKCGIKPFGTEMEAYKIQRQKCQAQENQAIISTENEDAYKIILDMQDYMKDDLKVKIMDDSSILVECAKLNEDGTPDCITYSRRFNFPSDADLEAISSALAEDGILTITAPKMPPREPRKSLVPARKGPFFTDAVFKDSVPNYKVGVKSVLQQVGKPLEGDEVKQYETLRKTSPTDENQAIVSTDLGPAYEVLLDLEEFKDADVQVKVISDNDLLVEATQVKDGKTQTYQRHVVLPNDINTEAINTMISSDGILSINAPFKKPGRKPIPSVLKKPLAKPLAVGIAKMGSFFIEPCYADVRPHFQNAVLEVLKREGIPATENPFTAYRVQRERVADEENQAVVSTEGDDTYKVVIDMGENMDDEMKINVVGGNNLEIECFKKNPDGTTTRTFHRRVVLPGNTDMESITSALSSEGILAISAPKIKEVPDQRKLLPVVKKGVYFKDKEFEDSRPYFMDSLRNVLESNNAPVEGDGLDSYKNLRKSKPTEETLATVCTEDGKAYKIALDMDEFKDGNVKVVALSDNDLLVEATVEKDGKPKTFKRHFVLPNHIDIDNVASTLTTDGILSINAPMKATAFSTTAGKHIATSSSISSKAAAGKVLSVAKKASFFTDATFEDARPQLQKAVMEVLKRESITAAEGNEFAVYRDQRKSNLQKENQAIISTETEDAYKTVMDMQDFVNDDLKIQTLPNNNLLVECSKNGAVTYHRQLILPATVNMEAITSNMSSEGILTINALKEKETKPRKYLPLVHRGVYFKDAEFEDSRPQFMVAVKNILKHNKMKPEGDGLEEYRKNLKATGKVEDQSVVLNEDEKSYKIVVDMDEYKDGDVKIQVISDNDVLVEATVIKDGVTKKFKQHFVLPNHVDIDAITSVLTTDGVLNISAPMKASATTQITEKHKASRFTMHSTSDFSNKLASGTELAVTKKASFFSDATFGDVQERFKTAVKDVLDRSGIANVADQYTAYRSQRMKNLNDETQAIISTECDDCYKVVMDMQDFAKDDLKIKTLNDNSLLVECYKKKPDGSTEMSYQRRLVFPGRIDLEAVTSNLASEGILTIIAPKEKVAEPLKSVPMARGGLYFKDAIFEDSRPHFLTAATNILKHNEIPFEGDGVEPYRKQLNDTHNEDHQAVVNLEDEKAFKIVLDMDEFKKGDVNVKILSDNDLLVEASYKNGEGKTRKFKRHFVLPNHVDKDAITSVLTDDGVLSITAPYKASEISKVTEKLKTSKYVTQSASDYTSEMAPGTAITVEKKTTFFSDAAFKDVQEQLKTSMRDILKRAGVKDAKDEYAAYRSEREKNTTDDNQAIISTEHDDHYKVLIDMQDFKGDVSIKSLNDNSIMVECHKKKKSGALIRTYQRRIVFPGHINLEAVTSNLSKEGILSIFAPKRVKDTRKTIPISRYGLFFSDAYFEDYRPHFATAIKDIVKMTKEKNVKDTLSFYRKLRKESGKEEEQAMISIDDSQSYKIVLDMSKFKPDDITIKILDNNDLMVEVKEKKKDGTIITKGFRRQCVLPDNLDLDKLSSAISSDGILTITAPLKPGQTINNVAILATEVKDKLKIGGSLAIKQQGSFFSESMFEEVRQTFTSSVKEVLTRTGITDAKDDMATYRSLREKKVTEANQAIISKECNDYYKIMLDMKEFDLTGDVRVKRLNKDTIVVESYRKKERVFQRCFVLPHNVAIEAASADISSDGILTITAPKKSMMPALRSIPVDRSGGLFFVDEKFVDYRPHMKNAMKDVVHANGITEYEDEIIAYRDLRKKGKKEDDMAAITFEERKSCKISFDMEEYKDGEIKVYVLSNNDILIEVYQKKEGTTSLVKTFSRHFVLPNFVEMDHISSMLSSDGILTIYAPRKGVPLKKKGQKDDKEETIIEEVPTTKTTVGNYFSVTTKGVFSSDEAFTDVQEYLDTALTNVLARGGVKAQGDKRSIYKTHRQQLRIEENQAVLSTEIGKLYKIVLDMHDFLSGDIKVKLLSANNILVQAFKEKNAAANATPYFQRRFVFPYHIDVEAISCLMSSDGVLTVTAPKKPEAVVEDGPVTKTVPVTLKDNLFFDNTDDTYKDFRPKFRDAVLEMLRGKGLKPKDEDAMQLYKDLYETTQDEDNLVAINSEEATTYKMAVDLRDFLNGIHRVHVLSFNDLLVEVVEKKKDGKALRRQFILPNRINMDALTSDVSKDGILTLNAPRTDIKVSKMIEKWEGPREAVTHGDRKSNVKMGTFFTLTKREGFFEDDVFSDVRPHYEAAARNVLKRSDVMTKDDNVSFYNQFRETNKKNEEKRAVISNETDDCYKIIIDMAEFKDEEIRVKMLATNNLIVEGVTKADQMRCFYRRFIFPHKVCIENVHSDLSSDGVLTVTVTKTFATQSSRKISFKKKVGESGNQKRTLAFKGLRNF
ncbi:unnamed protein product [Meganyctiphanes norvegica]|uniref:SHSP domain-containing protein n=1 Tax=Meganyctiphanes norvegica TaxID=48144 RepID=A0AAV2Q5F4_MEGNR